MSRDARNGTIPPRRRLRRYSHRIAAVCRRVLRNPRDVADARQENMLPVARKIGSFEGRSDFGAWIDRISTNVAIDLYRRAHRREIARERFSDIISTDSTTSTIASTHIDVNAALDQLPDEYREAVMLRNIAELDYANIAEMLDVPIGTVRSRTSRGREMRQRIIEQ